MVPVGRLVLLRSVSKAELVRAMAYLTVPALIGPILGPPVGGFITTYLSWHWNFFINIPLGVAGLLLVARFIPGARDSENRARRRRPRTLCPWFASWPIRGRSVASGRGCAADLVATRVRPQGFEP